MARSSTQSPIDDLTYDVMTVLQKKAEALEAYDRYVSDARAEDDGELEELFAQMRRHDEEDMLVLKEVLAHRLDEDLGYDEDELNDEDELDASEEDEDEDDEIDSEGESEASSEPPSPRRPESTPRQR